MLNLFVGFVLGLIVMDFAWAYKMGYVRIVMNLIRSRFAK